MKNSVINFKTKAVLKRQAQKKAEKLGVTLTSVLNAFLREFLEKDEITFMTKEEKIRFRLSNWAERQLVLSNKEAKEGYVSPTFDSAEDAIDWLNDDNARYKTLPRTSLKPSHPRKFKA